MGAAVVRVARVAILNAHEETAQREPAAECKGGGGASRPDWSWQQSVKREEPGR